MTQRTIRIIIFLTALALLGLITAQLFWMQKANHIAQKQFGHRVNMALNDVVKELQEIKTSDTSVHLCNKNISGPVSSAFVLENVDTLILRKLLNKYLSFHQHNERYEYGIVNSENGSILLSSANFSKDCASKNTVHKVCISCLCQHAPLHLEVIFPDGNRGAFLQNFLWISLSALFIFLVVGCFSYTILLLIKQKKLGEMKSDFINNMTHEFKTPISTISLAAEVLRSSGEHVPAERLQQYTQIIFDENQRMRKQVERVLNVAMLEKEDFQLNRDEHDLHELITASIESLCLQCCSKPVDIIYKFEATYPIVNVDELHISNVIKNLVDNAVKYSCSQVEIKIRTVNIEHGISVEIADNGIGMSRDAMKHIFDKFYRVPTGNLHDVKGFGLGLYYVKTMIVAHGGYIKVSSEHGKGSVFTLYIPQLKGCYEEQ